MPRAWESGFLWLSFLRELRHPCWSVLHVISSVTSVFRCNGTNLGDSPRNYRSFVAWYYFSMLSGRSGPLRDLSRTNRTVEIPILEHTGTVLCWHRFAWVSQSCLLLFLNRQPGKNRSESNNGQLWPYLQNLTLRGISQGESEDALCDFTTLCKTANFPVTQVSLDAISFSKMTRLEWLNLRSGLSSVINGQCSLEAPGTPMA